MIILFVKESQASPKNYLNSSIYTYSLLRMSTSSNLDVFVRKYSRKQ